ncbi:MAG: hypothetical protein CBC49_010675, partial [Alphaproteobacteria bacterium TMED89]
MPKLSQGLPAFMVHAPVTWARRTLNVLCGVVGVGTILGALIAGDLTGGEPILTRPELVALRGGAGDDSSFDFDRAEARVREIRAMAPSEFAAHMLRVRGRTDPHRMWLRASRQLYAIIWQALPDAIQHQLEAVGGIHHSAPLLWVELLKLCNPDPSAAILMILQSLLFMTQGADSFDVYYARFQSKLSEYRHTVARHAQLDLPHFVCIVAFLFGLSPMLRELVTTHVLTAGIQLYELSFVDLRNRIRTYLVYQSGIHTPSPGRRARDDGGGAMAAGGDAGGAAGDNDQSPPESPPPSLWEMSKGARKRCNAAALALLAKGQRLCWNCNDPNHVVSECTLPCGNCKSKNCKRMYDRKTGKFYCQKNAKSRRSGGGRSGRAAVAGETAEGEREDSGNDMQRFSQEFFGFTFVTMAMVSQLTLPMRVVVARIVTRFWFGGGVSGDSEGVSTRIVAFIVGSGRSAREVGARRNVVALDSCAHLCAEPGVTHPLSAPAGRGSSPLLGIPLGRGSGKLYTDQSFGQRSHGYSTPGARASAERRGSSTSNSSESSVVQSFCHALSCGHTVTLSRDDVEEGLAVPVDHSAKSSIQSIHSIQSIKSETEPPMFGADSDARVLSDAVESRLSLSVFHSVLLATLAATSAARAASVAAGRAFSFAEQVHASDVAARGAICAAQAAARGASAAIFSIPLDMGGILRRAAESQAVRMARQAALTARISCTQAACSIAVSVRARHEAGRLAALAAAQAANFAQFAVDSCMVALALCSSTPMFDASTQAPSASDTAESTSESDTSDSDTSDSAVFDYIEETYFPNGRASYPAELTSFFPPCASPDTDEFSDVSEVCTQGVAQPGLPPSVGQSEESSFDWVITLLAFLCYLFIVPPILLYQSVARGVRRARRLPVALLAGVGLLCSFALGCAGAQLAADHLAVPSHLRFGPIDSLSQVPVLDVPDAPHRVAADMYEFHDWASSYPVWSGIILSNWDEWSDKPWILDSGAVHHYVNETDFVALGYNLRPMQIRVHTAGNNTLKGTQVGSLGTLNEVVFVQDIPVNLISVRGLTSGPSPRFESVHFRGDSVVGVSDRGRRTNIADFDERLRLFVIRPSVFGLDDPGKHKRDYEKQAAVAQMRLSAAHGSQDGRPPFPPLRTGVRRAGAAHPASHAKDRP